MFFDVANESLWQPHRMVHNIVAKAFGPDEVAVGEVEGSVRDAADSTLGVPHVRRSNLAASHVVRDDIFLVGRPLVVDEVLHAGPSVPRVGPIPVPDGDQLYCSSHSSSHLSTHGGAFACLHQYPVSRRPSNLAVRIGSLDGRSSHSVARHEHVNVVFIVDDESEPLVESAGGGTLQLSLDVASEPWFAGAMGSHSGIPASGEQRVPIAEALLGLEVHPLEPGDTAIEAFVLLKLLDSDGHTSWGYRTTNRLNREELLGALIVQVAVLKKELRDEWDDD